jgi:nucleoside triphosphate pyrophosphatase
MSLLEPRIYLASRSPRRRELLHQIRVNFEPLLFRGGERADPDVAETANGGEAARDYVVRIARAKALAALERIDSRRLVPYPVLAADTTIELDGSIIGKPDTAEHAAQILRRLAGRHRVLTALALAAGRHIEEAINESQVRLRPIAEEELRRYVASGEPLDKAGAYAIQGRAAVFIEEIHGSYSGIMGLPLFEAALLLKRIGYPL